MTSVLSLLMAAPSPLISVTAPPPQSRSNGPRSILKPEHLPLLDAAKAGDFDTVKRLIDQKHDVNEKGYGNWTPLLRACEYGHLTIAKFLVENGASVHQESAYGDTALMKASTYGHTEVVEWLIKEGVKVDKCKSYDETNALWNAVSGGHFKCFELLVNAGASIEHVDKNDTPLLIHAAYSHAIDVVAYLISKGADPLRTVNKRGRTCFLAACYGGRSGLVLGIDGSAYLPPRPSLEMVDWLLKNVEGINVHEVDSYGRSAMQGAIETDNLELAKRLLELGCEIPKLLDTMHNGVAFRPESRVTAYLRSKTC